MARFLDDTEFIEACKKDSRNIKMKVMIDWFNTGEFEEIEYADDELIKLTIDRELEGDLGTSIMDKGTLVLDNSNGDYSPKSIASRFNIELSNDNYEFNVIPDRAFAVKLSVNGSEYKIYYTGLISSIEPNYDNSRVSLTIEDYMIGLQNSPAPDTLFVEKNAKEVIKELLDDSPVDYDPEYIDNMSNLITYNFYDEGNIYNALLKLAEVVWGRFFVIEDKLRFINLQSLNQSETPIIDTIKDDEILDGYSENLSVDNLYNDVEISSTPYLKQGDKDNLKVIWSGTEDRASIVQTYTPEDLTDNKLQLMYTPEDTFEKEKTNKVPIIGGSLRVTFGENEYSLNVGIEDIESDTGLITFSNSEDYPLPDKEMEVSYSYYILTIPANNSMEIIAEYDMPSIEVQDIGKYLEFENALDYSDVKYAAYKENLGGARLGSSGNTTTNSLQLSDKSTTVQITGYISHHEKNYKWSWGRGTKYGYATSRAYLIVNGVNKGEIGRHSGGRGGSSFSSKRYAVPNNASIEVKLTFDGNGEKSNKSNIRNLQINVGETYFDNEDKPIPNIKIEQENFENKRKTKLNFINDSDEKVVISSVYKGENIDNIYLLGVPISNKDTNFTRRKVDRIGEEGSPIPFDLQGNQLSITNNLFNNQDRIDKSVDFLLDYYSRPRTKVMFRMRGRGHLDLMDKVHFERKESDIDNDFIINVITDEFTEQGEWNQSLELRQAKTSKWVYDEEGKTSIVSTPSASDKDRDRPDLVRDLQLSLTSRQAGNSTYPAIKASWVSNSSIRFHNIYIKRELQPEWELVNRIEENEYIFDEVFDRGDYSIKIVSESYQGLKSEFAISPVETIRYLGADIIPKQDIKITELRRKIQKGNYVPVIEIKIANYLDEYFDELEIYYKRENTKEYILDGRTTNLTYELLSPELGYYYIKVLPVDKHGNKPDLESVENILFEVTGKSDLPSKVELKSIYWGADYIEFTWKPHPDEDFDEYQLRKDKYFD